MAANDISIKSVWVGDAGVGKTCMMLMFRDGESPDVYVPTV